MNATIDQREQMHRLGLRPEDFPELGQCKNCETTAGIDAEFSLLRGTFTIWCGCGNAAEPHRCFLDAINDWNKGNT